VDRAVQGPVAAAVESVPNRLAAAGLQRAGARQRGEGRRRFGSLSCGNRADAAALGQPGSDLVNDDLQLSPVGR
jgi:hypothetical protein